MTYFIILHYMVFDETIKCANSILKLKGEKKVIIVDNHSPNNSFKDISEYFKSNADVYVIKNKENNGYASGINFGYDFIRKNFKNMKFIIAMNNDMIINQNDFIIKLKKIYESENFFVLGPDIYSTSKKIHQNPGATTIRTEEKINSELKRIKSISLSDLKIKSAIEKDNKR